MAICKLVPQLGKVPEEALQVAAKWVDSSDISLAQYCSELKALCDNLPLMQAALPVDASCEDIEIDPHLPFLDDFVGRALQNGAQPYLPNPNPKPQTPNPEPPTLNPKPQTPTRPQTPTPTPTPTRTPSRRAALPP